MTLENAFEIEAILGGLAGLFKPDRSEPGGKEGFEFHKFTARSSERHTVLGVFGGRIGLPSATEFKAVLQRLGGDETDKIMLDFCDCTLTRSALGVLVEYAASVHGRNKHLYLYRPSGQVRANLKELELSGFFSVLNDEHDVIVSTVP
ncbi:MAG: STAS domain-containing protein [Desulfovibrio sp.]|jgi:anti-anti-sigma regulatory factor|nr:STAS domain-containing protein [Desulfovibrio sp.]